MALLPPAKLPLVAAPAERSYPATSSLPAKPEGPTAADNADEPVAARTRRRSGAAPKVALPSPPAKRTRDTPFHTTALDDTVDAEPGAAPPPSKRFSPARKARLAALAAIARAINDEVYDDKDSTDNDCTSDHDGGDEEDEEEECGVTEADVQELLAAFYAPGDLPEEDDVIGDPDYYPDVKRRRAAVLVSIKAGLFASPGPYMAATDDPAGELSPLWQLPDEIWIRVFQLGWCFLPMGRLRLVCRRFYALACAVTGRALPTRRTRWCYHCFRVSNFAYRRYTRKSPGYLCEDCAELPMYDVMNQTRLIQRFGLTRTDLGDGRRADYALRNPLDPRFAPMQMFYYTTAMTLLADKWGQPYADATRALDEWCLLPFPKPTYVSMRQLELAKYHGYQDGQAALAAKKQETLAEQRALRGYIKKLLTQCGLQGQQRHPVLLEAVRACLSRDKIATLIDRLQRWTALETAFREADVVAGGFTIDLMDPEGDLARAQRAGDRPSSSPFQQPDGYELLGRQFVHFSTMNGKPTTAAVVAAIARAQVARQCEAEKLINAAMPVGPDVPNLYYRQKRWTNFPHHHAIFRARSHYVLHGDNLDELRQLANEEAVKEAEHLSQLVTRVEADNQRRRRQQEARAAAADPWTNVPGRLNQLAVADVPMRWVTIGPDRVPDSDDADNWLSYFLSTTERSNWIAEDKPLTLRERFTALVHFGRATMTDQYKLSALPQLVRPCLKPGYVCPTFRGPYPPPPAETSAEAHVAAPAEAHDAMLNQT